LLTGAKIRVFFQITHSSRALNTSSWGFLCLLDVRMSIPESFPHLNSSFSFYWRVFYVRLVRLERQTIYSCRLRFLLMLTILSSLHKFVSTLLRLPRTRGFGVQSPFAYRFLREVITERWPYYAYDDLKTLSRDEDERRLGQLLLRLSNHFGPRQWYFGSDDILRRYKAYVSAGCHRTQCISELPNKVEIALLSANGSLQEVLQHVSDDSVLILLDLRSCSFSCRDTMRLTIDAGATACFDLYNEAIIFFNSKLYPHIYKVNYS